MNEERNFSTIFSTVYNGLDFGHYFFKQIEKKGWMPLVYGEGDKVAAPDLVRKFYSSFEERNYNKDVKRIRIVWDGIMIDITPDLISEITGIPIQNQISFEKEVVDYVTEMGVKCVIPKDGGISGDTMYSNVYAACRWVNKNIIASQHTSSFYVPTLHIVHCLMLKEPYCMCSRLLQTIGESKQKVRRMRTSNIDSALALPVLVTMICRYLMGNEAFKYHSSTHSYDNISIEHFSRGYKGISLNWVKQMRSENIIQMSEIEEESEPEDSFWDQPTAPNENWGLRIFRGIRKIKKLNDARFDRMNARFDRMNARFDRIEEELAAIRLSQGDEGGNSSRGRRSRSRQT